MSSKAVACWCCASIVPCRPHCGNPVKPARYMWTTRRDDDKPLCVECCARWRELQQEDPASAPKRIRELENHDGGRCGRRSRTPFTQIQTAACRGRV